VNLRNDQRVTVIENLSDAQLGEIIAKAECTGEYNRTIARCSDRPLLPPSRICDYCRAFNELKRRYPA
jgi:hypothetical protein